ncbi:MAG: phytoene desaturase [Proteobacteria bacterium]|nr:phytoene desaturase [Pseudomonadota bacterium]
MAKRSIIIVGGGIGGLSAGMRLAARGVAVTVIEKEARTGGKLRQMQVGGRQIDCGPTVLTMRHVFDRLFAECGRDLSTWVRLRKADLLARHVWEAGETLDLFADRQRSADAVGRFAGAAQARGYLAFTDHARKVYETMDPLFMRAERPSPLGMVRAAGISGMKSLVASAPFTTLWDLLGKYFTDPRLRQLFGRYATYCGSSPFEAPATLAVVAHVEQQGVWLVEGGVRALADALESTLAGLGAEVRRESEVREIIVEGARAVGVRLGTGEAIRADGVIANCDVGALAAGQLGAGATRAVAVHAMMPRSLSAATWGMVGEARGVPLAHHTVFFSHSSEREFDDLFRQNRPPRDPTVYICAQDRNEDGFAAVTSERLFSIVNAPADNGRSLGRAEEIAGCRTAMMERLARCGLELKIEAEEFAGPATFARRYPGTDGAIYGMASHGWAASFRRPGVRSNLARLYLAGGSVHPGAGMPMAAISGMAAAQAALTELSSS